MDFFDTILILTGCVIFAWVLTESFMKAINAEVNRERRISKW